MHIECVGFSATAPGASGAAASAFTGDSLTIKNAVDGSKINLLSLIPKNQTLGFTEIYSPLMHDSTRGIRVVAPADNVRDALNSPAAQIFYPQDSLTAVIAGSATAGDVEQAIMNVFYENLPGINQNLLDVEGLKGRIKNLVTVYATISASAGPGYSGSEALNADSDLLHANTDYAVLGATVSVQCACVTMKGPDLGNVRIAVPGEPSTPNETSNYFIRLSQRYGMPLIPVINSANKASTFLEMATDEDAADTVVAWLLAELTGAGAGGGV